jgi:hypothetical protein
MLIIWKITQHTEEKKYRLCILDEKYNRESRNALVLRSTREIACRASSEVSQPKTFPRKCFFASQEVAAVAKRAVASHRANARRFFLHAQSNNTIFSLADEGLEL